MMSDLGVQTTVLEALPRLLPGCDDDIVNVVARSFKRRGIDVRTGVKVEGHEPHRNATNGGGTTVHFEGDSVAVDAVVISVGRRPLSDNLDLSGTAVELDPRGYVVVDELMRTGEDGVYAVGDLVATPQLAHVGFAEAIVAIQDILGERATPVDYSDGAVVHLLPSRGRVRGAVGAGGARSRPRCRLQEDAVLAQRSGSHRG